jgi:membrane-bound metal-dependent hydrolase YbcI (DUF457 family)
MYADGHAGLSLLVLSSLVAWFNWTNQDAIVFCILIAILSSLPDLDLKLWPFVKHRGALTHSLFAGGLLGIGLAFLVGYAGFDPRLGFVCGFGGIALHLLGDIFTFTKIKLFWPFSQRAVAFGVFKSSNQLVNKSLMALGGLVFLATVLRHHNFVGQLRFHLLSSKCI